MTPPHGHSRPVRLIAIASGKGGVGKTWLSITLAHALARAGDRTLLFDGDLGLANVDVQLGLTPSVDLGDILAGKRALAEAVQKIDGGAGDGGFDVLAGRSGSGTLAQLARGPLETVTRALHLLSAQYDRTIVDLGAGIDQTVLSLTAACDVTLVVLTDEPTSLTDAYALIKMMSRAGEPRDIRVVANMAPSTEEGQKAWGALANACRNFLKFEPPLVGLVRRDTRVKDAIKRQLPILTRHPNATAALDVCAIAKALRDHHTVPAAAPRRDLR